MNPEDSSGSGVGKDISIDTDEEEKGQLIIQVSKWSLRFFVIRVLSYILVRF